MLPCCTFDQMEFFVIGSNSFDSVKHVWPHFHFTLWFILYRETFNQHSWKDSWPNQLMQAHFTTPKPSWSNSAQALLRVVPPSHFPSFHQAPPAFTQWWVSFTHPRRNPFAFNRNLQITPLLKTNHAHLKGNDPLPMQPWKLGCRDNSLLDFPCDATSENSYCEVDTRILASYRHVSLTGGRLATRDPLR